MASSPPAATLTRVPGSVDPNLPPAERPPQQRLQHLVGLPGPPHPDQHKAELAPDRGILFPGERDPQGIARLFQAIEKVAAAADQPRHIGIVRVPLDQHRHDLVERARIVKRQDASDGFVNRLPRIGRGSQRLQRSFAGGRLGGLPGRQLRRLVLGAGRAFPQHTVTADGNQRDIERDKISLGVVREKRGYVVAVFAGPPFEMHVLFAVVPGSETFRKRRHGASPPSRCPLREDDSPGPSRAQPCLPPERHGRLVLVEAETLSSPRPQRQENLS